jgi:hypothetical protein
MADVLTDGMWEQALQRVNQLMERARTMIGFRGGSMWFYIAVLEGLVARYNRGERTQCLYDEMMEVEE